MSQPLLSVVATSRNDNHGDDMVHRMQAFVNGFIGQCKRHNLHAELILVEWNPPADRARLPEVLEFPDDMGPCQVRIIEVPNSVHRTLKYSEAIGLYQMIAKNVGIRRARGRYVLVTNIDILFSDELIAHIAEGNLQPGVSYRIDRYDVKSPVPIDDIDEQTAHCRNHYIRVATIDGVFTLTPDGRRALEKNDVTTEDQKIRFESGWSPVESYLDEHYRWSVGKAALSVVRPDERSTLRLRLEPGPGVDSKGFTLLAHSPSGELLARGRVEPQQCVHLALAFPPGKTGGVILTAENGGLPTPWTFDARTLDFRLLDCRWSKHWGPAAANHGDGSLNFLAEDIGILADNDIADPQSGIRFGRGWHSLERQELEPFRWAGGTVPLTIESTPDGKVLCMEVQPGPGVGSHEFELVAHDIHGHCIARGKIQGRQVVYITLPRGFTGPLYLRAADGGKPTGNPLDPRILDFRVFAIRWERRDVSRDTKAMVVEEVGHLEQEDITPQDAGIRFARGWHSCERFNNNTRLRWADDNAVLIVSPPPGEPKSLCLDLDPGASVGMDPFMLRVLDRSGTTVARGLVQGRQRIHLALPFHSDRQELTFIAEGGGRPVPWPNETRILNFRAVNIDWSNCFRQAAAVSGPDEFNFLREEICFLEEQDISAADANIRFGRGFHFAGHDGQSHFRLVDRQAFIHVHGPCDGLNLIVRRGNSPIHIQVRCRGVVVGNVSINTEELTLVRIPVAKDFRGILELQTRTESAANSFDPPLQIRRCALSAEPITACETLPLLAALPHDVHDATTHLIAGWHCCESSADVPWRWCGRSATLLAESPHDAMRLLCFDLEPMRPTTLQFRSGGKVLLRRRITGRETVSLPWTQNPGVMARIEVFAEEEPMAPANSEDQRLLSFRVFDLRWNQIDGSGQMPKFLRYISRGNNLIKRIANKLRTLSPVPSSPPKPAPQGSEDYVAATPPDAIVRPPLLHTCACGDFALLSREDWFALKAYPELQLHSFHLDSLFLFIAAVAGIRQEILEHPMQIFHMEHSVGSGWTPEGADKHFKQVAARGIKSMTYEELRDRAIDMIRRGEPINDNDDDWGFATHDFKETAITATVDAVSV